MPRRQIIIDTDPGQDDAVALVTALGAVDEIEVLGVTAVAGNVPLALTQQNARKVLELAGRTDVPVFAGASAPLVRPRLVTAEHVHGVTGLDGYDLPEPTMPLQSLHASDFIIDAVMSRPDKAVTICVLGPATNIALALAKEPRIASRIHEIVWMAGAQVEGGNITPAAEFNVYVDPHAGARLMASGIPIVMMPLDVTHKAHVTVARIEAIRALGNAVGIAFAELLTFAKRFDAEKYGVDYGPLHDPTTIVYLIKPEIFAGKLCNVEIETASELTMGQTVVDWWHVTDRPKNCLYIRDIDDAAFFEVITRSMARL